MRVSKILTMLFICFFLLWCCSEALADSGEWIIIYPSGVDSVALFDIDRDGFVEVLGSSFIYDRGVIVEIDRAYVFKADFDGDNYLDLIMYYPSSGSLYVYSKNGDRSFVVDRDMHSYTVFGRGFRVGSYIFGAGRMLAASERSVPLVYGDRLYAVEFNNNNILQIYNTTWRADVTKLIGEYNALDAGVIGDRAYVVLSSKSHTAIVGYDMVSGVTYISLHPVAFTRCFFTTSEFLCLSESGIYSVLATISPLLAEVQYFSCVERVGRFVVFSYPYLVVFDYTQKGIDEVARVAFWYVPQSVDVLGNTMIVSTSMGVYMYTTARYPSINVQAPSITLVGDPIEVQVSGTFDYAEVLVGTQRHIVNTSPSRVSGYFTSVGNASITVRACIEGDNICVVSSQPVRVLPRPMKVLVDAPSSVEPYANFDLTIKTYDSINGTEITTATCRIILESTKEERVVSSFKKTILSAIPTGNEVVISFTCFEPNYISVTNSIKIDVSKPYLNISVRYVGSGRFVVEAYNLYTGELYDGTIRVTVNNVNTSTYLRGAMIAVPPGNHVVLVELLHNGFILMKKTFTVTYYGSVFEVPVGEVVKVADRYITSTVTTTQTTTMTRTEVRVATIEKVDALLSIGLVVIGLGIGLSISILSYRREKGKNA
ncbi:MAG: hypothetical protein QXJ97_04855 [Desulfurococcaceae archaeon]